MSSSYENGRQGSGLALGVSMRHTRYLGLIPSQSRPRPMSRQAAADRADSKIRTAVKSAAFILASPASPP